MLPPFKSKKPCYLFTTLTLLLVQAESLRATAETKDINIRIAYGMTVLQMRM